MIKKILMVFCLWGTSDFLFISADACEHMVPKSFAQQKDFQQNNEKVECLEKLFKRYPTDSIKICWHLGLNMIHSLEWLKIVKEKPQELEKIHTLCILPTPLQDAPEPVYDLEILSQTIQKAPNLRQLSIALSLDDLYHIEKTGNDFLFHLEKLKRLEILEVNITLAQKNSKDPIDLDPLKERLLAIFPWKWCRLPQLKEFHLEYEDLSSSLKAFHGLFDELTKQWIDHENTLELTKPRISFQKDTQLCNYEVIPYSEKSLIFWSHEHIELHFLSKNQKEKNLSPYLMAFNKLLCSSSISARCKTFSCTMNPFNFDLKILDLLHSIYFTNMEKVAWTLQSSGKKARPESEKELEVYLGHFCHKIDKERPLYLSFVFQTFDFPDPKAILKKIFLQLKEKTQILENIHRWTIHGMGIYWDKSLIPSSKDRYQMTINTLSSGNQQFHEDLLLESALLSIPVEQLVILLHQECTFPLNAFCKIPEIGLKNPYIQTIILSLENENYKKILNAFHMHFEKGIYKGGTFPRNFLETLGKTCSQPAKHKTFHTIDPKAMFFDEIHKYHQAQRKAFAIVRALKEQHQEIFRRDISEEIYNSFLF
jgi:hypothetical protein